MGCSTVATLEDAIRGAVRKHKKQHGSVIVRDGDGYDVIPSAYLTDVTYSGPREVVATIDDLTSWAGPEAYDWDEDELVSFVLEAVAASCE